MSPGPAGVVAGGTTSVAAITPGAAPPRPSGIFPMLLCTTHYHPPHPSPMLHGLGKPGPPIPWTEGVSQNPFPADMWGRLSTQKQVLCAAQAGCASTPSCYELAAPDENPHSPSTDGTRLSSPHCTNCGHHPPPKLLAGTSAGCLFPWDLLGGQKRTLHSLWKETLLRPAAPSRHIYNLTFHFFWMQSLCL